MKKYFLTSLSIITILIAILVVRNVNASNSFSSPNLGAVPGPHVFIRTYFHQGLTRGGSVTSTTSNATTYTTVSGDFAGLPSVILWNATANITISLSSTSTLGYVPNIGDVATLRIRDTSATANTITLAAVDANTDIQKYSATGSDLTLAANKWWDLVIIRMSEYKVAVFLKEFGP